MIDLYSIRTRFLVSFVANVGRSLISFLSGLLIAKGLNPAGYGDYTFLLGSFTTMRILFEMGSANAFYTFISQRSRNYKFYSYYMGWLLLQFVVTSALITFIFPGVMIENVWLGHSRKIVLLAFAAIFVQQQFWQTIIQIAESLRKTVLVQTTNALIAVCHLGLVAYLFFTGRLSISVLFLIIIGEYLVGSFVYLGFIFKGKHIEFKESSDFSVWEMLEGYWKYCKPLIILSVSLFFYEFSDRWLMQHYGGASQQGLYQVAFQFSNMSQLITASVINIFWKEIANANEIGDSKKVADLYGKVMKRVILASTILSGMIIPWSREIVLTTLGKTYLMTAPVLSVMFLFPVHKSMGQITGAMMLACGYTRAYTACSLIVMLINLPLTYLTLAPHFGVIVSGLGLGAIGMAVKTVALNISSVNMQSYIIAKYRKLRFDFIYQFLCIGLMVGIGYLSRMLVGLFMSLGPDESKLHFVFSFLLSGVIYTIAVAALIYTNPQLIQMGREGLNGLIRTGIAGLRKRWS